MSDTDDRDVGRARDLVIRGGELAGSTAGAAWLLLDPSTGSALVAAGGATIAATLTGALYDAVHRSMSPREQVRVGAALGYATQKAYQNLMSGDDPRDDGFFESHVRDGRPPSDEIAEAALRVAQQQPEERKVQYVGYLLGNIGFKSCPLHRVAANYVVRLADSLSYTQLQLLALVHRREEIPLPPGGRRSGLAPSWEALSIGRQFWDLGFGEKALIEAQAQQSKDGSLSLPTNLTVTKDQQLAAFGLALVETMNLDRMPLTEVRQVAAALWEVAGEEAPPELTAEHPPPS